MDTLVLLTTLSLTSTLAPLETTLEYEQPREYNKYCDFVITFKTQTTNGSVFYATNGKTSHYVALHLQDGYHIHMFNGGNEPAFIRAKLIYNSEQWHKIVFSYNSMESLQTGYYKTTSNTNQPIINIEIFMPFKLSGLSEENTCSVVETTLNVNETFQHCLKNFEMNGKLLETGNNYWILACIDGTHEEFDFSTINPLHEESITDAPSHEVNPPVDDLDTTEVAPTCALPLHPVTTQVNDELGLSTIESITDASARDRNLTIDCLEITEAAPLTRVLYQVITQVNDEHEPSTIGEQVPPHCTDNAFFANCKLIVKAKVCKHRYYSRFCCKSCTKAGQLNVMALI